MTEYKLVDERLEELATIIESEEHARSTCDVSGFDATSGFNMNYVAHNCGTPSCIAGYAAAMYRNADGVDLSDPVNNGSSYDQAHAWLYGMSTETFIDNYRRVPNLYLLFEPFDKSNWEEITPAQAATVIRSLKGGNYVVKDEDLYGEADTRLRVDVSWKERLGEDTEQTEEVIEE